MRWITNYPICQYKLNILYTICIIYQVYKNDSTSFLVYKAKEFLAYRSIYDLFPEKGLCHQINEEESDYIFLARQVASAYL